MIRRCSYRSGVRGSDAATGDVAAQDPPIGPGAELALELHDAPDPGPVNPHVRFYVCSNPVNGCQEVRPVRLALLGCLARRSQPFSSSRDPGRPRRRRQRHPTLSHPLLGVLLGPDWPGRVTELGGPPGTAHVLWESLP